jgi:hypothetical protein
VTAAPRAGAAPPGLVLRRSLIAWGLGDLALGRRRAAATWLAAEVLAALVVAWLVIGLAETTAYLVPFLAGCAFLAAWTVQAALAYQRARATHGATGPTPIGSPAAAMVWLSLPLLLWGTAFWLVGAQAATPAAVLDRFETRWSDLPAAATLPDALASNRLAVTSAALAALTRLETRCEVAGSSGCGSPATLLRNLRITVTAAGGDGATAVAQVVSFERRPSTFLWFIAGTELVPVPQETVLTLELRTVPATLPGGIDIGARRWQIVNASPAG